MCTQCLSITDEKYISLLYIISNVHSLNNDPLLEVLSVANYGELERVCPGLNQVASLHSKHNSTIDALLIDGSFILNDNCLQDW